MRTMALAAVLALAIGCSCPDQFEPGVIIVSGDSMEALAKGGGLFFVIRGAERVSRTDLKDMTVLRGLVLTPAVGAEGSGVRFERDCLLARETFAWRAGQPPEQKLTIYFNGRTREAMVGAQSFDTRKGNILIIKLDATWKPVATQLASSGDEPRSLADLRRVFPNVPEIQTARLSTEAPE